MIADRHKRVEAIFLAVADLPREQWDRELAERCAGDTDVQREVRSLLGCHERADQFLDENEIRVQGFSFVAPDTVLTPGMRVGEYSIVRMVGVGGMGHVYIATQDRPRRTVAIKIIRRSVASDALLRRFEHEAEVLGRLHHPGIAQIFEAGAAVIAPDSPPQPFIAMELVNGPSLTAYADQQKLGTRARLELLARVCDAVHHAHQRGVIHRDLKPANILVDERGGGEGGAAGGQPKVLDFGVARAADADLRVTTLQTSVGQLIGTLPYMSPEQVVGDPAELDTRSDVYALGVVLYELLTGRLPYDFSNRALPDAARLIRDEPPARLSTVNRTLRGDVETIVNKALAKEKVRRYQSAADLAADIRAYLDGRPITARQDSALYVVRKQMVRHKGMVAAAAVILIGILTFAVYANMQARANAALADTARRELASSNIERARSMALSGNTAAAEDLLWPEHLTHLDSRRTFFALWELYAHERCEATVPLPGRSEARRMRLSPDGRLLALSGGSSMITIIDTQRLEVALAFGPPPAEGADDTAICFYRSGQLVTGDAQGHVSLWDPLTGAQLNTLFDAGAPIVDLACNPVGDSIALILRNGTVALIDARPDASSRIAASTPGLIGPPDLDPRILARWQPAGVSPSRAGAASLAFSPTGDQFAVSCRDNRVRVVNVPSLTDAYDIELDRSQVPSSLTYSPDGSILAAGRVSRSLRTWNARTGEVQHSLSAANGGIRGVAITPDNKQILAVGWWYLQVWDLESERVIQTNSTRVGGGDLCVSPDGQNVYGDLGSWVRVWELDPGAGRTRVDGQPESRTLACFTPDGHLLSGERNGEVRLLTDPGGELIKVLGKGRTRIRSFSFSPTAPLAVAVDVSGFVMLFDLAKREKIAEWPGYWMPVNDGLDFDSTGSRLVLPARDGAFKVIAIPSGEVLLTLPSSSDEALAARFSPDDRLIAVSRRRAPISIYDAATGALLRECERVSSSPWCLEFSPDGSQVLSGTWSRTIDIWSVATGRLLRRLNGHRGLVTGLAFRPGEPTILASCAGDGQMMLWDISLPQNTPILTLGGFDNWEVWALDFDRSGRRLIGTNSLGLSVIWDLRYFNRHIGGNMAAQIEQHRAELGPDFNEASAREQMQLLISRGKRPGAPTPAEPSPATSPR